MLRACPTWAELWERTADRDEAELRDREDLFGLSLEKGDVLHGGYWRSMLHDSASINGSDRPWKSGA